MLHARGVVGRPARVNKRDGVSSAATDHEEIAANAFAAALLMPRPMMNKAINRCLELHINTQDQVINYMAKEFDVSYQAMQSCP